MPRLVLLPLSDSFAAVWPALAAECGLVPLERVDSVAAFERLRDAVGIVAAGGDEGAIAPTLQRLGRPPGIEIAAVGAVSHHRLASAVVRAGAAEYFALPGDYELLRSWLRERGERLAARSSGHAFAAREVAKYRFDGILGASPALKSALARAARVIPHRTVTVLIGGETGTGKELLARAIHYNGPRAEAPFVDINCAAIPEQLLESELFGHEKGAFTDASVTKPGLFELANGGTLLLDEIGQLALALQGKLLRVLEERQIRRIGGTHSIPVDVRVIAATHRDLAAAVQRGQFRGDLYYRLNVVPIVLPPLRARRDDIGLLARSFLARFAAEYGLPEPELTVGAERALAAREWRGNVRELRNLMERTLLLSGADRLEADDIPAGDAVRRPIGGMLPFPATLGEITRSAAEAMVDFCGGNKSEAARKLGVSRPRLQRLLDASAGGINSDEEMMDDA